MAAGHKVGDRINSFFEEAADRVVVLFWVLFYTALSVVLIGVFLLFWYGVAVIVFRYAFGVDLPNPFDWFR